jgi:hypothetical protein
MFDKGSDWMNKALKISLIYIGLRLAVQGFQMILYTVSQPINHSNLIRINVFSHIIGLIALVYLLYMVIHRINRYPMLRVFVVLLIAQSLLGFLFHFRGLVDPVFYLLFQYVDVSLTVLGIVIGVLMLIKGAWPAIVSIVLFLKWPISLGYYMNTFIVRYIIERYGVAYIDIYSSINLFVYFMMVGLTAWMLYVLYYEKEERTSFSYEEGY